MPTVAASASENTWFGIASTVTVTPTVRARVKVDAEGAAGADVNIISSATSFSVPAGGRLFIEAVQGDATWSVTSGGSLQLADGSVFALSEAQAVVTLTATGTAFTGACEFRGIVVRAISGTPQTITVYDATSATGTAIAVFTVSALGAYYWDGDWTTAGNGNGGRRINSTGCHVVISGGTSRTIDVMVA